MEGTELVDSRSLRTWIIDWKCQY